MKLSDYQKLTSQPAKKARTNRGNDGRKFQEEILNSVKEMQRDRKHISAYKIDPPVRVMGSGQHRKTIFMRNPFLDFTGSYFDPEKEEFFRIDFEAKATQSPRLPINAKGGITPNQIEVIRDWLANGSNVFVLWQFKPKNTPDGEKVGFIGGDSILEAVKHGEKSIRFNDHRVSNVPARVSVFGLTWGFYGHVLGNRK
jgi:penicillin-binding protein-related factor A (putative recombinase)